MAQPTYSAPDVPCTPKGTPESEPFCPDPGNGISLDDNLFLPPRTSWRGTFKDTWQATLAAAKQDTWKIVCVKATSHVCEAPKGKHVRLIMDGLRWGGDRSDCKSPTAGIYYNLRNRLMQNDWVVVLKAQAIFHHCFRDGNPGFINSAAEDTTSQEHLSLPSFSDRTEEGLAHTPFITLYGAYLAQWLVTKDTVSFPPRLSVREDCLIASWHHDSSIEELLLTLPAIMDTTDALVRIPFKGQTRFTPVAAPSLAMLVRDFRICSAAMSSGLQRLRMPFFELEIPKAKSVITLYKRFFAMLPKIRSFSEDTAFLTMEQWTPITSIEISSALVDSMQNYIDSDQKDTGLHVGGI